MIGLLAAAVGAAATLGMGMTTSGTVGAIGQAPDKAAIERIVRDYILEHPEILPQAMERLQARENGKVVAANRALIETPFAGAWEGAANGDVVLVEFFDYACGYCRASLPVIDRLLREDTRLKVVYREMPVLGPDSDAAAALSLQVAKAGRYAAFHRALYAAGRPDKAARERLARDYGVDGAARPGDGQREIASNLQLQNALRLTGTPSWVVGDQVISGAVGYDQLRSAIAEARRRPR